MAIAIGSNHGNYTGEHADELLRVAELNNAVAVPLVMHGGSRLTRDDYRNSISAGIAKVNIAADMSLAALERLKVEMAKSPQVNYVHLMSVDKKGVKESVRRYMLYFDYISKAI